MGTKITPPKGGSTSAGSGKNSGTTRPTGKNSTQKPR
jgi:hypothetical protein